MRTALGGYHVDTCRECGGRLQIVAYINDHFTIKKVLDHLGLNPPEVEPPPSDTLDSFYRADSWHGPVRSAEPPDGGQATIIAGR